MLTRRMSQPGHSLDPLHVKAIQHAERMCHMASPGMLSYGQQFLRTLDPLPLPCPLGRPLVETYQR
jgi:hypothetical protein